MTAIRGHACLSCNITLRRKNNVPRSRCRRPTYKKIFYPLGRKEHKNHAFIYIIV